MPDATAVSPPLELELRAPAAFITLSRPEQRNPMSLEVMEALGGALDRFAEEPEVRAIVIRADGPAFSSGHDLRELVGRTLQDEREIFDACAAMMQRIQSVPQPVIAQVQGTAAAAGCQLVAACDLALAAESAKFLTPGVRIGLFCSTPMVALSRAVGRKRALEMLLTGAPIDAHVAAQWGLINHAVPDEELERRTWELVEQVSDCSPLTMRIGKRAFYDQIDRPQAQAYATMGEVMATNAMTCDAQEGMSAFLDKRRPVWRGE
ncbi:MAG: enoyl-CoA hydratase [Solirubrobacterales bacterium]|nr:enoyl-CoA hydratase [Solirubrobacterales bacterium]